MTKEEVRKQWRARVEEYKLSGLTQAAWCREKNINLRTFNYWCVKLKKESQQPETPLSWISLSVQESSKKLMTSSINVKIGNAVIEVKPDFDAEHFLSIAKVLSTLC